jgi:hypothetical protein
MAHIRCFVDLQTEVLAWLDEAGDTATTQTLAKQAIVAAHEQRLTAERWPFMLWQPTQTITINMGQQIYSLHPEFLRPLNFRLRSTLDDLTEIYDHNLLLQGDWSNLSNWDTRYMMWNRSGVNIQPSAASTIAVASSSGSDSTATVVIRGDTAGGTRNETITSGTTGLVSFTRILRVTKVGIWIGTMTLTSNAGAVPNLTLFPEEYGRSYPQIVLIGTPSQADFVDYSFYRQPSPLVLDQDLTDIPPPFEELLVWDALLAFSAYNTYDAGMVALWTTNRDNILTAMRTTLNNPQTLGMSTNYTTYVPR